MCTRSIAPMCILVKDHSRVLCEQLQQLRLQTGLVDLDIVCEDHHINVHKVVMAACSKFFKDQLCKQNVQVPVILRLEDFGLELKRDAVSYIIEFVYRGEVNIPGEKLTEVCAAAHTLGVVGLEHLPVPAEAQRPALISKDHLQIADESELRGDINSIYSSFTGGAGPSSVSAPTSVNKFSIDINHINPFLMSNNTIQNTDDIIMLQTADDDTRNINEPGINEPDIIPISFGDTPVVNGDMSQNPRLYQINNPMNLNNHVSAEPSYRIIPEIDTFHDETIDTCLSLFPNHHHHSGAGEAQDLSPAKAQEPNPHPGVVKTPVQQRHQGKNISNFQQSPMSAEVTIPQTSLQALFEAASMELVQSGASEVPKSSMSTSGGSIVFSSPSSMPVTTVSSMTQPTITTTSLPSLQQIKPSGHKTPVKGKNNSMSQGKLRVINQGIQSENIQSPICLEKARRRSGQVSGCQDSVAEDDPDQAEIADEESDSEDSDGLGETEADPCETTTSGVFSEEIWSGNKSWTHPVESVDTSVPTSGAVWQLPSTVSTGGGPGVSSPASFKQMTDPPPTPTIPWNTPVESLHVAGTRVSTVTGARDTPPSVSVSWTQPQTSACPSPVQRPGGVLTTPIPSNIPPLGAEMEMSSSSSTSPHPDHPDNIDLDRDQEANIPGPSWKTSFGADDNMLAIRSGIPLALQNKAIRSGVPIGPFENKRKRKSRCSQEGGKTKKKTLTSNASSGGKKGDLEVRKDLILDPHDDLSNENVFVNDESCASTSNIVSKTKEESTLDRGNGVNSPVAGSLNIKTVKKLNSDAVVAEFDLGGVSEINIPNTGVLKRHSINVHKKEEPLSCQFCPEICYGNENLKLHLYKTHAVGEIFRCEDCNFESPVKTVYIKHLAEHIPEETVKKKCPKCEKVFKTKTGLNMHLKQHFDESLYSCKSCDFKTPQKLNLVKHTASKHGQDIDGRQLDATFACEYCDFRCIAEHMLKNHVMRKHTQKSAMRFRCNLCNYATVEKAALDKHMRFKHTNERPFMCDTCGFSTHTASAMARHKRSHSNSKPYKCEICGAEYADKKRLRDHMYIHSDHKPFQCQLCSYTCRRKDNLLAHLKKNHETTKMEKQEKCEVTSTSHPGPSVPPSGTWTNVSQQPEIEPPKPVWQEHVPVVSSQHPVARKSAPSSIGSIHLPTIALGDIVLTSTCPTDTSQTYITSSNVAQEITWTVDTSSTDHEEVIFVPQQGNE